MFLFLWAAGRLSPNVALEFANASAGDRMVPFTRGGRQCVRIAVATRSAGDRTTIASIVEALAKQTPLTNMTVERRDGQTEITGCDPSLLAEEPPHSAEPALVLLGLRNEAMVAASGAGLGRATARCVGGVLYGDPTVQYLATLPDPSDEEIAAFWHRWRAVVSECDLATSDGAKGPGR
jgi:hypothetical protein